MKTLKVVGILSTFSLALTACGGGGGEDSAFPDGDIELIVAFPAGGSSDTGARLLADKLEEELDTTVTVVNYEGAGGWVGWNQLEAAEPDGYTLGYTSSPNFSAGYLNPDMGQEAGIDSFTPLANHISDTSVIAVHPDDERFEDVSDLIEYAQDNTLTGTGNGAASDDHLAILKMNDVFDMQIETIQYDGAADSKAALLGRHVDVGFMNVGDVRAEVESGDLNVLAVLDETRNEIISDVPTLEEEGWENIENAASRSVLGPADMPPEVVEKLTEALESVMTDEAHMEELADMGLTIDYQDPAGVTALLEADEEAIQNYSEDIGWTE